MEIFRDNYSVYGARKIWAELKRRGHRVARCTVERLMKAEGLTGAVRGKKIVTTVTDREAERAPDRLGRQFVASAPNRVWVADFTYVATWSGTVYVAFVVDPFSRRIVGWSAATNKQTPLVHPAFLLVVPDGGGVPDRRPGVLGDARDRLTDLLPDRDREREPCTGCAADLDDLVGEVRGIGADDDLGGDAHRPHGGQRLA